MSELSLYLIEPHLSDYEPARSILTPAECERADRFFFDTDRREWVSCRASVRRILGSLTGVPPNRVKWMAGESGKPYVKGSGLDFNLTHSGGLAALLVSTVGSVGIDMEPLQRGYDLLECAASFCHPDEINQLPLDRETRAMELIQLWTAKEALLKAHGSGLGFPPTGLIIKNGRGYAQLPGLHCFRLIHPTVSRLIDYCLAAAVPPCEGTIEVVEYDHGI